jgi:hypothetical protein
MDMDEKRRCGTCKFWVPEDQWAATHSKAKYPWPHCSINGKVKVEDDKPCLAWTRRKEEK